jgi:FlaA1/EpsC-like NDP-sugar epimerase
MLALDWMLAVGFLVGSRAFLIWLRHWFASLPRAGDRRVLIIGASDAGSLALRLLSRARDGTYRAVGFLDDDPGKRYRRLGGVPIVGTVADLEAAITRYRVDVVLYANEWPGADDLAGLRETSARLGAEWREFAAPTSSIRPAPPRP